MNKFESCKLVLTLPLLLLSVNASAATLARQFGAFGIVTHDPVPVAPEPDAPPMLARQCGAFGIVTYDSLPDPSAPEARTRTTDVSVPYGWLKEHCPGTAHEYYAYESSAKATAANGRKVWECYAVGLDPTDATDDFRITSFPMKADGTPDFDNLVFDPPQSEWNVSGATPKMKGKASLADEWQDVPSVGDPSFRFFTVDVVLP